MTHKLVLFSHNILTSQTEDRQIHRHYNSKLGEQKSRNYNNIDEIMRDINTYIPTSNFRDCPYVPPKFSGNACRHIG